MLDIKSIVDKADKITARNSSKLVSPFLLERDGRGCIL